MRIPIIKQIAVVFVFVTGALFTGCKLSTSLTDDELGDEIVNPGPSDVQVHMQVHTNQNKAKSFLKNDTSKTGAVIQEV